jgi:hypothetical protein
VNDLSARTIEHRAQPRIRWSRWTRTLVLTASVLGLGAVDARAQMSFAAEGRAAVTLPTGDLSDAGASSGIGLGAELQVNFTRTLTGYVGFNRFAFGCEEDCSLGDDPTSIGFGAGLKYIVYNPGDVFVWARGGVAANKLESDSVSNDRGIGFEVGVGADMPIGTRLYLVPNLGYVSHEAGDDFTASFFTLGIGVHYHIN